MEDGAGVVGGLTTVISSRGGCGFDE